MHVRTHKMYKGHMYTKSHFPEEICSGRGVLRQFGYGQAKRQDDVESLVRLQPCVYRVGICTS